MDRFQSTLEATSLQNIARIMGEAKVVFFHEDGIVQEAFFISTAPVRGFEKLVIGKNISFAIKAVMRICGVCHVAHANAISDAVENALALAPLINVRHMRELLGLVNRIQTHLLLLIMASGDMIVENRRNEIVLKLIRLYDKVSDCLLKLGGGVTHPPYLSVCGLSKPPKWSVLNHLRARFPRIKKEWEEIREELIDEDNFTEVADELRGKIIKTDLLASDLFFGDRYRISYRDVQTVPYWEYREQPRDLVNQANCMVALYKGKLVEVGPRARLLKFTPFTGTTLFGLYTARIAEIDLAFGRICELLDVIDTKGPFRKECMVYRHGKGVGIYEAPRGTLFHHIELDEEGRVEKLKIITPTMFNIPVIESSVKGLTVEAAEVAVRLFDPCIPCATHVERI
ncbi:nickel-dependent hydrogenase large subunit [Thermococcus barophilus]|uniref:FrhAGB-like [NiFe]-hydrogenase alpha subunit n=1 Tax=Thermococcus barophilus TaxID=55802 RepID=A0A0S1XD37_THEBA|nr:nickel-dependent hydrogenase large subunit [Thermococcus barophilus]ALM75679.1 frhAGB-like [NiFe]-hydrogenase alpha subunit [Thermococcus barophilus]